VATIANRIKSGKGNRRWRWFANHLASWLAVASTLLVVAPLIAIFVDLVYKGASSLNWNFFTKVPAPVGEMGGGMANAIVRSCSVPAPSSPSWIANLSAPAPGHCSALQRSPATRSYLPPPR